MLYEVITVYQWDQIFPFSYQDASVTQSTDNTAIAYEAWSMAKSRYQAIYRITSYNVCYTKLLRPFRMATF